MQALQNESYIACIVSGNKAKSHMVLFLCDKSMVILHPPITCDKYYSRHDYDQA